MTNATQKSDGHFSALDTLFEDDDAVDLLHAIRSWNLRKSGLSNPHRRTFYSDEKGVDEDPLALNCDLDSLCERRHGNFSSFLDHKPTPIVYTVTSQKNTEDEDEECTSQCTHMTDSDCTESPCSTKKSIHRMSPCKQALSLGTTSSIKGNYSAKPSSLTWRLLDPETFYTRYSSVIVGRTESSSSSNWNPSIPQVTHDNNKMNTETKLTQKHSTDNIIQHHEAGEGISQEIALSTLLEICRVLGLDAQHELHIILPTIEKLVKVIMNHVPRLEFFAHSVCQIILNQDSRVVTPFAAQDHDVRHKEEKPVFYKAKKKDMDLALHILHKSFEDNKTK